MNRPPLFEQPTCHSSPLLPPFVANRSREPFDNFVDSHVVGRFPATGGGGNNWDGPTTDVVGGIVTIVGGIGPNRDLGFGKLGILDFGVIL
ncbi:hypothetical protein V6N12_062235 [Hibiscus sabdariffa]|uniref:Uncharacterized protein n=1 Tax=Hibiscus sabdariffa TaxID=183260 RepID=A0ABR2F8A6_9ROSI